MNICGSSTGGFTTTEVRAEDIIALSSRRSDDETRCSRTPATTCPSCGHPVDLFGQVSVMGEIHELPGLPAGVKFDPSDREILEHLEAKIGEDVAKLHPLIDEFILTLEDDGGICHTHPEKLPGVRRDGQVRHFFHRPLKAYTTGTRKRRKVPAGVNTDGETRWHKTGKTRPILVDGMLKGFKKILVLYMNFGKHRKPEKTNWVMHQYHLGNAEEEKDGEFVVSKIFYQTQPRQCGVKNDDKEMEATTNYGSGHSLHGKRLREEYCVYNPIQGGDRSTSCDQDGWMDGHWPWHAASLQLIPDQVLNKMTNGNLSSA